MPRSEPVPPASSHLGLPERLLALASAASEDGGAEVLRVLRAILAEQASFDAGEVAIRRPTGCERWALAEEYVDDLVGEDLLLRASVAPGPTRVDDLPEIEAFPRTLENLRRGGYRSLLLLPLSSPRGMEGAVVLACRHGWAFAGASLATLAPVARMAGLALERALTLTRLGREIETLCARQDALRLEIAQLRAEAGVARGAARDLERRLREAVDEGKAARDRLGSLGGDIAQPRPSTGEAGFLAEVVAPGDRPEIATPGNEAAAGESAGELEAPLSEPQAARDGAPAQDGILEEPGAGGFVPDAASEGPPGTATAPAEAAPAEVSAGDLVDGLRKAEDVKDGPPAPPGGLEEPLPPEEPGRAGVPAAAAPEGAPPTEPPPASEAWGGPPPNPPAPPAPEPGGGRRRRRRRRGAGGPSSPPPTPGEPPANG